MTPTLRIQRKLKDRKNAHQMARRQEKRMARSVWRDQMMEAMNKGFGAVVTVVNGNQTLADRRQKLLLVLHVAEAGVLAYVTGRVLGWW